MHTKPILDYSRKHTLFNLIACHRTTDDRINLSGCLCHDVTAKYFWFDQPAVSKCSIANMTDVCMNDKFWTVFPSLNLKKALNPMGADETEIIKTLEHNSDPMILMPYGPCMADVLHLLPYEQNVFLFIPLSDMPVMSVVNRLMNLITFRRAVRKEIQDYLQLSAKISLDKLPYDDIHDMLDIVCGLSDYRPYQTQPMAETLKRTTETDIIGTNGADVKTMAKKAYYGQRLKPGMTVKVTMKPFVVGRGHLPVYEGVITQSDKSEDGIYLRKTTGQRSDTYLAYHHIEAIEILTKEKS